jgi:AmmeMemoRadiSam system protein B/AmmeMemoRadiSam system protein A
MKKILFLGACLLICFCFFGCRKEEKVTERKPETVRQPVVAGTFYPGTKEELEAQIETFFQNVPEEKEEKALKILIVPHAGYEYSGQVAAFGFKQTQGKDYKKVILIGGSHQAFFEGAVIDESDDWETPLGKVGVDTDLAEKIIKESQNISFSSSVHAQEHSLEVELPFLQKTLSGFKIVPILLGETSGEFPEILAGFLAENISEETLIVVSTDLSHYPPYNVANEVDRKTVDSILSGELDNFSATISAQMEKGYPSLVTCACGHEAVKVGMVLAEKLRISDIRLLKYANSGDVSGDMSRVVGYAAIGFYQEKSKVKSQKSKGQEDLLDEKAQKEALEIARETLESYLKDGKTLKVEVENEVLNQKLGAFVTLRKNGQLRGCIGRFEPNESLWQVIQKMAISAAAEDLRFPPVTLGELKNIEIEISVLSPRRKIHDWHEIELGKHGVYVQKGMQGGVFLPQVATENNWDLETFMGTLCTQKAGLPWDCWKQEDVDLFIFTAQVFEKE